jgi:hypothetical protein
MQVGTFVLSSYKTHRTVICLLAVCMTNMKVSLQHWNLIILIYFYYQTVNIC